MDLRKILGPYDLMGCVCVAHERVPSLMHVNTVSLRRRGEGSVMTCQPLSDC